MTRRAPIAERRIAPRAVAVVRDLRAETALNTLILAVLVLSLLGAGWMHAT